MLKWITWFGTEARSGKDEEQMRKMSFFLNGRVRSTNIICAALQFNIRVEMGAKNQESGGDQNCKPISHFFYHAADSPSEGRERRKSYGN